MKLSPVIKQFEHDFYQRYANQMLPSHHNALSAMKGCRSEYSPVMKLHCNECKKPGYLPHSCGHRNCPHCQHHESQAWIDKQLQRQVKGTTSLITFTVPAQLRSLCWSHQRDFYSLMFTCIWETLQTFSQNDKKLQGMPGAIAVLHTHNRRLNYHPHIHVIMPMAAIDNKKRLWREKNGRYLFSHKALAKVYRAKMLEGITALGLKLPRKYPKQWVVDCQAAGEGKKAIIYLGRYLYRGVIQEKDILSVKEGKVTFRYQNGQTKRQETRTVSGVKFLWLLVQHVLPRRFRRSRNYGFLHPNSKRLKQIQLVTQIFISPPKPKPRAKITCPCCGGEMRIVQTRLHTNAQRRRQPPALKPWEATV